LKLEGDGWQVFAADPTAKEPYYQGQRFAHTGMAPWIFFRGVPLHGEYFTERNPAAHDHVSGLADEFDIDAPQSFARAEPGEAFLKIGVGLLVRPDEENYRFHRDYEMRTAPVIRLERADDRTLRWRERLEDSALGYEMTTELAIEEGSLISRRTLTNLGTETLRTEFYGHHFFQFGGVPIGETYSVQWDGSQMHGILQSEKDTEARLTENGLGFFTQPTRSFDPRNRSWEAERGARG
jgi:hypothetical protein